MMESSKTEAFGKIRIAILAAFPVHLLPGLEPQPAVPNHYATWLPQLVETFASAKHFEIHWVTLTREIDCAQKVTWQGQTFHLLTAAGKGTRATSLYHQDRAVISACLEAIQPDLVHGWGSEDVYGLAAVLSGRRNIVSMQGLLSAYVLKNRVHPRDYLQALLEIFILYRADCVTVESEWGKAVLKRRNPWAWYEIIEYGVTPLFLESSWNPDPIKPVALFVGSLTPRKGIQDLVEAFKDPDLADTELWVVGEGSTAWVKLLKAASPANIRWLGGIPREEVAQLMHKSWLLALPSRADTSPNVVKEARVMGMPVITSPHGGQRTYIVNDETGFLVEPGDIPSLKKALKTLLKDYEACIKMGRTSHQEHRQMLHPKMTAEKLLALYRQMKKKGA